LIAKGYFSSSSRESPSNKSQSSSYKAPLRGILKKAKNFKSSVSNTERCDIESMNYSIDKLANSIPSRSTQGIVGEYKQNKNKARPLIMPKKNVKKEAAVVHNKITDFAARHLHKK